jgi:hypothetical protein
MIKQNKIGIKKVWKAIKHKLTMIASRIKLEWWEVNKIQNSKDLVLNSSKEIISSFMLSNISIELLTASFYVVWKYFNNENMHQNKFVLNTWNNLKTVNSKLLIDVELK